MLNIVLFGPPGAGKGTQSENLIKKYNLVHLSTGDILRSEIAAGTQLGIEAKMLMDAGILVPDEVVIGMISSKLDYNKDAKGFIFDGFPRTTAQAEALDKLLYQKHTSITMMLALEVGDEELTKRLLSRGKDSGRPDDQNEGVIRNRISEYNNKTAPLKEYYMHHNKYRTVNGIGSVDDIFKSLCSAIEPTQRKVVVSETKSPERKVVAKEVVKIAPKVIEKPAPKVIEKPAPKVVVKAVVKKEVKKAAPKPARPVGGKVAKVPAKKVVKKVAPKKAVKKVLAKKVAKKVAKKAAPKKAKVVKKKIVKKVAAKKKAIKKVVKKVLKKVVKKASKPAKKAAKKVTKKIAPTKATKSNKKAVKKRK
jgi:adenylate kinase